MKRIIASACMVVVFVLASAGVPAHAAPVGGCSTSYNLTHTFKDDPVDRNGDRYICVKPIPSAVPNPGGGGESLVIDNTLPL
jgi:hypothetical protein